VLRAAGDKDTLDLEAEWVRDVIGLHGIGSFDVPVNNECQRRWRCFVNHLTWDKTTTSVWAQQNQSPFQGLLNSFG